MDRKGKWKRRETSADIRKLSETAAEMKGDISRYLRLTQLVCLGVFKTPSRTISLFGKSEMKLVISLTQCFALTIHFCVLCFLHHITESNVLCARIPKGINRFHLRLSDTTTNERQRDGVVFLSKIVSLDNGDWV